VGVHLKRRLRKMPAPPRTGVRTREATTTFNAKCNGRLARRRSVNHLQSITARDCRGLPQSAPEAATAPDACAVGLCAVRSHASLLCAGNREDHVLSFIYAAALIVRRNASLATAFGPLLALPQE
jgi:hypothetical protein